MEREGHRDWPTDQFILHTLVASDEVTPKRSYRSMTRKGYVTHEGLKLLGLFED